jgi:hypothetical protein
LDAERETNKIKAKHDRLRLNAVTQMVFMMNSERKVDMADVDHICERKTDRECTYKFVEDAPRTGLAY